MTGPEDTLARWRSAIDRLSERPIIGKNLPENEQTVKLLALERDWLVREVRKLLDLAEADAMPTGTLYEREQRTEALEAARRALGLEET